MTDHAELARLAAEATPGPWHERIATDGIAPRVYVTAPTLDEGGRQDGRFYVAFMPPGGVNEPEADARYIVAACNAVPDLLREREALLAQMAEAQRLLVICADQRPGSVAQAEAFMDLSAALAQEPTP